jgi:hypothetical protein
MSLPLRGWPRQVLAQLESLVDGAARHDGVYNFKIGRTNDITVRECAYGREYRPGPSRLVAIYETGSVDHALMVEGELIAAFMAHPKCLNEADHAGGNVSPDYVQYVYVALWERST